MNGCSLNFYLLDDFFDDFFDTFVDTLVEEDLGGDLVMVTKTERNNVKTNCIQQNYQNPHDNIL